MTFGANFTFTPGSDRFAGASDPAKLAEWGRRVYERLSADERAERMPVDRADMFLLPGFASRDECRRLVKEIDKRIGASPLFQGTEIDGFRTSSTHYFDRADPAIASIEDRIDAALGFPAAHGEQMQGQRYERGQQFKHHYDYFTVTEPYWQQEKRRGGQRSFTAMLFLGGPDEGGQTDFPELGVALEPQRGMLVAWNNMDSSGQPNAATLHAGLPVLQGTKHIVTKWYRQDPWTLELQ